VDLSAPGLDDGPHRVRPGGGAVEGIVMKTSLIGFEGQGVFAAANERRWPPPQRTVQGAIVKSSINSERSTAQERQSIEFERQSRNTSLEMR